jgi:DNA mismatch endonuclease (patch repair protein)
MSRIRGKNTKPELIVRSMLHRLGYRFRLHVRIPVQIENKRSKKAGRKGRNTSLVTRHSSLCFVRPDIVLPKYKTAIFVHGCFWHRHRGCKNCTTPTHRRQWWLTKLEGNAARDKERQRALQNLGWKVLVVWECESASDSTERVLSKLNLEGKQSV